MPQYNFIILRERQKKDRFQKARIVIDKLASILAGEYRVKKIVLIGSCLDEKHFHSHSDIDLCVEGLADSDYFGSFSFGVGKIEHKNLPRRTRSS